LSAQQLIHIHSLNKTYQDGDVFHQVLRGVELQVAKGECIALLGRSGSGKSTLLNLLAGIDRPDAGEVRVDGEDLHRLPERERTLFRRRHIGFVYQFFNLIPTLSVAENIRLPMELNGWNEPRMSARVRGLLSELGLEGRGEEPPDRLSGGEQQRVAIARALAHEPSLLLADEPTGNLDAETGRQMLDLLRRKGREAGRTLVIVTHSLEVARSADRLLRLEDGRVLEGGAELAW
jgi:putative ABC transport system ATP-binding protein